MKKSSEVKVYESLLKVLKPSIEATAEDPALADILPPVENNDKLLGFMSPFLRKFYCFIEKSRLEMHAQIQPILKLPEKEQDKRLSEFEERSMILQLYVQIFWIAVAQELAKTRPDVWELVSLFSFRKGWAIVSAPPQDFGNAVFIAVRRPQDGESEDLPQEDPTSSPPKKPRLN
jgi:hypothetical protein